MDLASISSAASPESARVPWKPFWESTSSRVRATWESSSTTRMRAGAAGTGPRSLACGKAMEKSADLTSDIRTGPVPTTTRPGGQGGLAASEV